MADRFTIGWCCDKAYVREFMNKWRPELTCVDCGHRIDWRE